MKTIIAILLSIVLFPACGTLWSVKYDFVCTQYITIYTPCPVVLGIQIVLDNATYERMREFESSNDCQCKPYVCP
jgi:hypothetical protein